MSNNDNPKKREKPELVWERDEFGNFKTTEESVRKVMQYYDINDKLICNKSYCRPPQ